MIGTVVSTVGFVWLIVSHDAPWQILAASTALGAGTGFTFASMVNLVIESVRPRTTGIATGVNIPMRTIGGTIGTQLAATVLAATLTGDGAVDRHGFEITFAIGAAMLAHLRPWPLSRRRASRTGAGQTAPALPPALPRKVSSSETYASVRACKRRPLAVG